MRLLIKGRPATAIVAAHDRGIKLSRIKYAESTNETVADVSNEDEGLKVVQWFCEPSNGTYPDGTLLFYTGTPK